MLGDRVISDDRRFGVIEGITLPDTEDARMHNAPNGGVTVAENSAGTRGYAFVTPTIDDGVIVDWMLRFISRGTIKLAPYGSGTTPWPYEPGPYNGGIREHEGPLTDDEKNSK